MMIRRRPRVEDFTIGWVCALPLEYEAAKAVFDDIYDESAEHTTGRIHDHEIALACLPAGQYGTTAAAAAVARMIATFPSLKLGLLVGIAGGVPSDRADIRLGDVVVSQPAEIYGGVVQYDLGRTLPGGTLQRTGSLNSPAPILLTAVAKLRSNLDISRNNIRNHIVAKPQMACPDAESDILFYPSPDLVDGEACDKSHSCQIVERVLRRDNRPEIFFGTIASGNMVIKDAISRDKMSSYLGGVLCFEMEAAGVMNQLPFLVARGICDYADSHKNKIFQPYAAATAAACAREILSYLPSLPFTTGPCRVVPANGSTLTNHGQELKPFSPEQKKAYLDSLAFNQINARHSTIGMAHLKTCQWLPKSQSYRDWMNAEKFPSHHGFLWIKGKPGSGKSTLMKFAFRKASGQKNDCTIISFFFNARGEDLEKSAPGMYRSLLFQLIDKLPDLQDVFSLLPKTTSYAEGSNWDIETLKFLFRSSVEKLRDRPLVCYIDALDECDEDQIRDMLSFFEQLGDLASSGSFKLLVCFSSRHYPHIEIGKGLELVLENQDGHQQDISTYVQSKLKAGRNKRVEQIREEIISRSSGIFLWVVLVVQILNKEHDRGQVHAMEKRLNEIPDGLHELLKEILIRDNTNTETTILCLQWILYAKRPLTLKELYFALLAGTAKDLTFLAEWTSDNVSDEDVTRYILNSSKGLAETTKSKKPTVQFIHESVRDFLMKEGFTNLQANSSTISPGSSHEALKQCCLSYVSIELRSVPIPESLPKAKSDECKKFRESVAEKFPFLEYAVQHVFYHADTASGYGVMQIPFLQNFPLHKWIVVNNLFEPHHIRRYTLNAPLLYILADRDFANLMINKDILKTPTDYQLERYDHPLHAAIMNGNNDAATALIQLKYYSVEQLNLRQDIKNGFTLLIKSVKANQITVAKLLLDNGADPNLGDILNRTPLLYAAQNGHESTVHLLLERGANIEAADIDSMTPLLYAAQNGHESTVRLLLERGASTEAVDDIGMTPLLYAAQIGYESIVHLLLERGANIEAAGISSRTPLLYAAQKGYKSIVRLLLDRGANIEAVHTTGMTPLLYATQNGHESTVHLLLDRGANIKVESKEYFAALLSHGQNFLMESNALRARHKNLRNFVQLTLKQSILPDARIPTETSSEASLEHGTPSLFWILPAKIARIIKPIPLRSEEDIPRIMLTSNEVADKMTNEQTRQWDILNETVKFLLNIKLLSRVQPWHYNRWLRRLLRPKLKAGYRRIEWQCDCGVNLYADFPPGNTEAIDSLECSLQNASESAIDLSTNDGNSVINQMNPEHIHIPGNASQNNSEPHLNTKQRLALQPPVGSMRPKFLALCVNTGGIYKTLVEIDASEIISDATAFLHMKGNYLQTRRLFSRLTFLVKPVTIEFVQFTLWNLRRGYVSIFDRPDRIPPGDRSDYEYIPKPLEPPIPMPPEVFIHYLGHDEGDLNHTRNNWLHRLPKRLDRRVVDGEEGTYGWGIHIIEGPNREVIFWVIMFTILVSVLASILWTVLRKDIQGGTGLGSMIVALPPAILTAFLFRMGAT